MNLAWLRGSQTSCDTWITPGSRTGGPNKPGQEGNGKCSLRKRFADLCVVPLK